MENMELKFKMVASRETLEEIGTPPNIVELLDELERAVDDCSSRAFDISKALVESVCKTIMNDRGIDILTWDLPKLLRNTLLHLNLLPPNQTSNMKAREGLSRTANGLYQSVQGLCELRNNEGIISHGPDGYKKKWEKSQVLLAARSADTIVHFLYEAHKNYPVDFRSSRLIYGDNEEFNDYIDSAHDLVDIFGLTFSPSEILFYIDQDHATYREQLIEYNQNEDEILT